MVRFGKLALGFLSLFLVVGCSGGTDAGPGESPTVCPTGADDPYVATPTAEVSGVDQGELKVAAQACNRFAFDLHKRLAVDGGNVFFSPFSAQIALAMTAAGAKGDTAEQMNRVLHLEGSKESTHLALAALIRDLLNGGDTGDPEILVANALWGQNGYSFLSDFTTWNQKFFGAPLMNVDFKGAPEAACDQINAWSSSNTREKIPRLLTPGQITPDMRLILTNAVYFKGLWARPFEKGGTKSATFTTEDGTEVKVPTMYVMDEFELTEAGGAYALTLPYQGGRLAMVVAVPELEKTLVQVEEGLDERVFSQWLDQGRKDEVPVFFPRFQFKIGGSLRKHLEALGMVDAFSGSAADFTGMTDEKPGLFIGDVVQEAFVDVDEEGTEAAAATAVMAEEKGVPRVFRANRPFLFAICDMKTGLILFLGRCANPTS